MGIKKSYPYVKINGTKFYKDENNRYFTIMDGQELDESGSFKVTNNNSAIRYYAEAAEFRSKILGTTPDIQERYNLKDLKTSDAVFENGEKYDENGQTLAQKMEWRRI